MNIVEPAFLIIGVDGVRHLRTDPIDCAESVRPRAEMSNLAKKLGRMSLLLQWVGVVSRSYDLDIIRNQFPFLSFTLGWNQRPTYANRRSS